MSAPRKRCKGYTRIGGRCHIPPLKDSDFCRDHTIKNDKDSNLEEIQLHNSKGKSHRESIEAPNSKREFIEAPNSEEKKNYNDECPICLENDNEFFVIKPCDHRIHLECAISLTNSACPLCREQIVNFPEYIKTQIQKNGKERYLEIDEENRRLTIEQERIAMGDAVVNRSSIQIEILSALQYLVQNGIPQAFVPSTTDVSEQTDQPPPPPGSIFRAIVQAAIEAYNKYIKEHEKDHGNISEDDSLDSEDPFKEDDERLSSTPRRIEYHSYTESDISEVMEQTGVSRRRAIRALINNKGHFVDAIMSLS